MISHVASPNSADPEAPATQPYINCVCTTVNAPAYLFCLEQHCGTATATPIEGVFAGWCAFNGGSENTIAAVGEKYSHNQQLARSRAASRSTATARSSRRLLTVQLTCPVAQLWDLRLEKYEGLRDLYESLRVLRQYEIITVVSKPMVY